MSRFAIIAKVSLKPGGRDDYLPLILANARAARDEPGCLGFEILVPEDEADAVYLYEVFENAAALDAHWQTSHFKAYREAAAPFVVDRQITRCTIAE